jgi:hypothetical protein
MRQLIRAHKPYAPIVPVMSTKNALTSSSSGPRVAFATPLVRTSGTAEYASNLA